MSNENGQADGYVGELSEAAQVALRSNSQAQHTTQYQIGGLEIAKAKLMGDVNDLQQQARRILDQEALRLGIPPGRSWQVTPDGKVQITG